mgnify:CR=1 FL=1
MTVRSEKINNEPCLVRIHYIDGPYSIRSAYTLVSATYSPWPTLDVLRQHLDIQAINNGQKYTIGSSGIFIDDLEGLHALVDNQGHIMLRSGVELPMAVYRGQPCEHIPCLPALARLDHIEDQFLALCRCAAFEEAISEHPYVRICEQTRFLDCQLFVDKEGLAQHYGLSTDLLDVTSNFEVATFFATSRWNNKTRSYRPVKSSSEPGVLYRIRPFFLIGPEAKVEFRDIGWQPLHRPEQQRASAIIMKKGLDFGSLDLVEKVRFTHSARVSTRIWKSFDCGHALFPQDAAAELADQAHALMAFTRHQADLAWNRFDRWHGTISTDENRQKIESCLGIDIVSSPFLSWDTFDIERDEIRLRDNLRSILEKVRFRMAA